MTSIVSQALGGSALLAVLSGPTTAMSTSFEEQTGKIVNQADQLYDSNKWREALNYLEQYAASTDVEVLWRLARLCYKVSVSDQHDHCPSQEMLLV